MFQPSPYSYGYVDWLPGARSLEAGINSAWSTGTGLAQQAIQAVTDQAQGSWQLAIDPGWYDRNIGSIQANSASPQNVGMAYEQALFWTRTAANRARYDKNTALVAYLDGYTRMLEREYGALRAGRTWAMWLTDSAGFRTQATKSAGVYGRTITVLQRSGSPDAERVIAYMRPAYTQLLVRAYALPAIVVGVAAIGAVYYATRGTPTRRNGTKGDYPFASKKEHYRTVSEDALWYSRNDAYQAAQAAKSHDTRAENWYMDDFFTITDEIRRRKLH